MRLPQFTIRDLLWAMAVISLVVVWRADLSKQDAVYRDSLRLRMGDNSNEWRIILHEAKNHPELLTELKAIEADNNKHLRDRASLNLRFYKLKSRAEDFYRSDKARASYAE